MTGGVMVKDLPCDERPREKLLAYGARSLSNTELLAVLLHSGTRRKSVLQVAQELLSRYRENGLASIVNRSPGELSSVDGIGPAKTATLLAAVELGLRLAQKPPSDKFIVRSPADAAEYAMPHLRYEQKEHFAIMLLNTKNHVLSFQDVSIGSLDASIVHPREVFRCAIANAAAGIILVHNHPSGDPTPSREDLHITSRLVKAGAILDIEVLDHIIIGDNKYTSLKEQGMLK